MDRLTKRREDGQVVMDCDACENAGNTCHLYECRNRLIARLAAYEETGMTPEQASAWENHRRDSVTIGRMADFLEAEADGRVLLLPCKPGEYWRDQDGDRVRIETVSFCNARNRIAATDMVTYSYEYEEDEFAVNWLYFKSHFTREAVE